MRKYLTQSEIDLLLTAAKKYGREPDRNFAMILMGYRHGLRVSELVGMRWSQIDWRDERLDVPRAKGGKPSVHPIRSDELKALRKLKGKSAQYVFVSQRVRNTVTRLDTTKMKAYRLISTTRIFDIWKFSSFSEEKKGTLIYPNGRPSSSRIGT